MNKRYILIGVLVVLVLLGFKQKLTAQQHAHERLSDSSAFYQAIEPGRFLDVKKAYSTSAVSTVSGDVLYQTPTSNLTNTLYGRLAGLTVSQGSGEPGYDNASLNIRGMASYALRSGGYKLFIDGFETSQSYFAYLSPAEIESVSILKDAAALATFGMNGANGVIYVITKRGQVGRPTVTFKARSGFQEPLNIYKPLRSYDYARLYNQAISNDHGNVWSPVYSDQALQAYQNGTGIDVDWYKEVIGSSAPFADGDLIFSGGDSITRYNVILDYANQNALYKIRDTEVASNEYIRRYNLRSNLDFKMFDIFEAKIDLGGRIEDRRSPNFDGPTLWRNMGAYPSNIYEVKDSEDRWQGTALYPNNPVASNNALGWYSSHRRVLQGNFTLKERLDFITPGLYMSQAFSFNSYTQSTYSKVANYARYFKGSTTTIDQNSPLRATTQSPAGQEDWKQAQATIGYERTFGAHKVLSALNYHQSSYRGDGFNAFAQHYQNVSGRIHYNNSNRYIGEFGFSYFGSDAYAPGNRWGFYPTVSAAWILSNESFMEDASTIQFLKIRGSVGKSGSTNSDEGSWLSSLSGLNGRNLYQQYYWSNSPFGSTYSVGVNSASGMGVLTPRFIANPNAFAEQSMKYNLGLDLNLLSKINVTLDAFIDKRTGILTIDESIPHTYGYNIVMSNIGEMTNKGFEAVVQFSDKINDFGYSFTGMAFYNKNNIDYFAEVAKAFRYNEMTNRPLNTYLGLVADGYYQISDFNADGTLKSNLPVPAFGAVQPGDLKYKDLDGDGRVDETDYTSIGKPHLPELSFSFGTGISYKGFELNALFHGASGRSVNLLNLGSQVAAFVDNGNIFPIASQPWAYYPEQGIDTRESATYPRLTTTTNTNNYRNSTFWMKSGNFFRIRNVELSYTFSEHLVSPIGLRNLRVFVNAVNPVNWSTLQRNYEMDPETLSGYPALKSYNAGISVTF